ncbi:hypothetical protein P4O66_002175 [Electrophorus voltai]|uniref:Uncharacterized protein n=1 Tax=Electrophorus voltai TaxID=2609070 RepID=A0AAD9DQ76_9TELE|nr:hypothetical protein P4O66_002175 [Electrophorus voltai]
MPRQPSAWPPNRTPPRERPRVAPFSSPVAFTTVHSGTVGSHLACLLQHCQCWDESSSQGPGWCPAARTFLTPASTRCPAPADDGETRREGEHIGEMRQHLPRSGCGSHYQISTQNTKGVRAQGLARLQPPDSLAVYTLSQDSKAQTAGAVVLRAPCKMFDEGNLDVCSTLPQHSPHETAGRAGPTPPGARPPTAARRNDGMRRRRAETHTAKRNVRATTKASAHLTMASATKTSPKGTRRSPLSLPASALSAEEHLDVDLKTLEKVPLMAPTEPFITRSREHKSAPGPPVEFLRFQDISAAALKIQQSGIQKTPCTKQQKKGVIVAMDCSFSMAMAHHTVELRIPVFVIMPAYSCLSRLRMFCDYGAMVISYGSMACDSQNHACHLAQENSYLYLEECTTQKTRHLVWCNALRAHTLHLTKKMVISVRVTVLVRQCVGRALALDDRISRFTVQLGDLARRHMAQRMETLAWEDVRLLDVWHRRYSDRADQAQVECVVESRDKTQNCQLRRTLSGRYPTLR